MSSRAAATAPLLKSCVGEEMKRLLMYSLVLVSAPITALAADWDHNQNIGSGVKRFLAAYKNGGLAKVTGAVNECYSGVDKLPAKSDAKLKKLEFCIGMDWSAYRVDDSAAKANGFPAAPFFTIEQVASRANRINDWFPNPETKLQVVGGVMKAADQHLNILTK
jgi:hypothetical protein